jgi:hypothetical protein
MLNQSTLHPRQGGIYPHGWLPKGDKGFSTNHTEYGMNLKQGTIQEL